MPTTTATELDAILHHAAVAPLTDRAFLRITGADATRWLNGMVTNSIKDLQPGQGNYNFLLNSQGRIQGDCHIYREPHDGEPTFLLETEAAQLEPIHQSLDKFIIMDDVELTPAFLNREALLVLGPEASTPLAQLGVDIPEPLQLREATTPDGPVLLLSSEPGATRRFLFVAEPAVLAALRAALVAKGLPEVSAETLEHLRLLEGAPRYATDIRDRDLPQETNQPQALHFNKGCYLGQEIVERIRSRGQVHRLFTKFELTGSLPGELPAPLESNGKPAGELTSAAQVGDKLLALGYARREFLDTHQPLTYSGGSAIPRS